MDHSFYSGAVGVEFDVGGVRRMGTAQKDNKKR